MDPVSLMMGATSMVGIGMSLFGTSSAMKASKDESQAGMEIGRLDMAANEQRRTQMELMSSRQQLQLVRNSQLARSMALTSATASGAQQGSGLQGGLGQISGQTNTESKATSQNLGIGENIFTLDNQIDEQRIRIAKDQGDLATAQGWQSLGGAVSKIGSTPAFAGLLGNLMSGKV